MCKCLLAARYHRNAIGIYTGAGILPALAERLHVDAAETVCRAHLVNLEVVCTLLLEILASSQAHFESAEHFGIQPVMSHES
jgi:hypothetical protein